MTPLHLEVALHCFQSLNTGTDEYTGSDNEALRRIHREFLAAGLLETSADSDLLKVTDRLRLYIEALCNVPLPAGPAIMSAEGNSPYAAILREKNIGDTTVKTRNAKIATVVDKYLMATPLAKM